MVRTFNLKKKKKKTEAAAGRFHVLYRTTSLEKWLYKITILNTPG